MPIKSISPPMFPHNPAFDRISNKITFFFGKFKYPIHYTEIYTLTFFLNK
jgi:hypothetical protein